MWSESRLVGSGASVTGLGLPNSQALSSQKSELADRAASQPLFHKMQIACQNRTMLSNAESRNVLDGSGQNCWKRQKCHWKSVRKAILDSRTDQHNWGNGGLIALESAREANPTTLFLAKVLRHSI